MLRHGTQCRGKRGIVLRCLQGDGGLLRSSAMRGEGTVLGVRQDPTEAQILRVDDRILKHSL